MLKIIYKKVVLFIMTMLIVLTGFFYSFNNGYIYNISVLFLGLLIFVAYLSLVLGAKYRINNDSLLSFLKLLNLKSNYNLSYKTLLAFFSGLSILISNIWIFTTSRIFEDYRINFINLLNIEISIISKILITLSFIIFFLLLIFALGKKIIKIFNLNLKQEEGFLFALSLGFVPIFFGTYLLLVIKFFNFYVITAFLLLMILFSLNSIKQTVSKVKKISFNINFKTKRSSIKSFVFVFWFVMLSVNFVTIFKPIPNDSDSLHTYYSAPLLYVESGSYLPITNTMHSSMGQNTEMLHTFIMSIFGAQFIIHLPLVFLVLTLVGFYGLLKRLFGEYHALLGVLLLYLVPMNFFLINTSKVDLMLAFYLMIFIYSAYLYMVNQSDYKMAILMGVFAGISMGVKYNAIILLIPVSVVVLLSLIIKKQLSLKHVLAASFFAVLFFSPWAIKNKIYFNNFLYPYEYFEKNEMKNNYFNITEEQKKYEQDRINEVFILKHSFNREDKSVKNFLKILYNQSVGRNVLHAISHNFGFFALFSIPFFFLLPSNKKIRTLVFISIIYFVLWFLIGAGGAWYAHFGFLFIYSLLPCLLFKVKRLSYFFVLFAIVFALFSTPIYAANAKFLAGIYNKEEYANANVPFYVIAQVINNLKLGSNEKILVLGDFKTAFVKNGDQKILYADPYLKKFGFYLNLGDEYLSGILRTNSVKYIIKSNLTTFFDSWISVQGYSSKEEYLEKYSEKTPSIYRDFEELDKFINSKTKEVFNDGFYSLHEITNL